MADGPDSRATEVIGEWERGRADLTTTLSHWQQVALYLYPDRADFLIQRTPGQKRMQFVYDAMPILAHEMAAAGMQAMMTSDALPWFATEPEDRRLLNNDRVRAWFYEADAADYETFSSPYGNFSSQSHEVYLDQLAFGPACMAVIPDSDYEPVFSTRHLMECVPYENEHDRIDKMCRRFEWPAAKAWGKWGVRAGEAVGKAVKDGKGDTTKFWFHHRVQRRDRRDPQRADNRNKAYESLYVCEADRQVIEEGGFDLFPYLYPRLERVTAGEIAGRGRGMMLLPFIKMLNQMAKIFLRHGQLIVAPPMQMPSDGYLLPIRFEPSERVIFQAGMRPQDRAEPLQVGGDLKLGLDVISSYQQLIREGFYNHLLLTPTDPTDPASAGKGVTATFTVKQQQEQLRILTAINSRAKSEWLAPLVERVRYWNFKKSQAKRFGPGSPYPPPPPELAGMRWRARFLSQTELAQRAAEMSAIDQLVQRQVTLRQIDPEAPMIIDSEQILRIDARDLNTPPLALKTAERLRQEFAAKLRQAQEQHEAEVAQRGTAAVANLAGARTQMAEAA